MRLKIYKELEKDILECDACGLGSDGVVDGRDPHVVGQGNLDASIMFVAEAPGEQETIHKRPLTPPGKSGLKYEKVLSDLELSRDEVFTTNVVACRPENNRDPEMYEVRYCNPFFVRQLELVKPNLVVTFGRFAACAMLNLTIKITQDHGKVQWSNKFGVDVFPLYHPAYVTAYAKASHRAEFDRDVKKLKRLLPEYLQKGK